MPSLQLIVEVIAFGIALWLGLYLIGRDMTSLRLWLGGLGLVAYAMALALDILQAFAPSETMADALGLWRQVFTSLPALFWPILLGYLWLAGRRNALAFGRRRALLVIALVAAIFLGLEVGLLIFPLAWLPPFWLILAMAFDLVLLGVIIAMLDALDLGEAFLPHFSRSFDYALLTALLFGGQVALAMVWSTGITFPMLVLLLTTISAAIVVQTFSHAIQGAVDRLAFLNAPATRQVQTQYRTAAAAAARVKAQIDPDMLAEAEFTRLTRRALSQMGNLPRLAANPLTRLPLVQDRLAQKGQVADTLGRAAELKLLLAESIGRLKPLAKGEFGTSDEWRHYNALYFPYVIGLRPYSRRAIAPQSDSRTLDEALTWFRTQVPERTLYNWQNSAAQLVAHDLREQLRRAGY